MKRNFIKKVVAFILTLTMLVGMMSTSTFAVKAEEGNITNVTNGKTFTLRKEYYDLLVSHSLYGTKDYIAYPWGDVFYIWFFNDDLTDVKFNMWDRGEENFGLYPSKDVSFTEYVYDKNTLEFIKSWDRTINTSNAYNYSYDFISSFNIYTDKSYSVYFYETKESRPVKPDTPVENEDITNVTNGKTFTLRKEYYDLLVSHSLYGTKDYIAYPWGDVFYIWFFNDNLADVKFSMWDRGEENFGLYPSKDVSFTEYVYDKNTLEFIKSWDRTINTSNAYNYSYDFISSFNIYTDKSYETYFYKVKDQNEDIENPIVTFEKLEPNEAKEFLRYISGAGALVNIEKQLPKYYNLLIGEIKDPEEELQTKVSFLTYLYYCLDAQMAKSNERINMGATHLIHWVEDNNSIANIIYSEVKDELVDFLKETIAESKNIPAMEIGGINIATAIMDYGELFIVSLGSIQAVRQKDEIEYLIAYKQLLEARATGDEINITVAEINLEVVSKNMTLGGNIEPCKKFATYLFNIEQSLPM